MTKFIHNGPGAVYAIVQDLHGLIWIGTRTGLSCYDSALQPKDIPPFPGYVSTLFPDREGTLWIGTDLHGLVMYRDGHYSFLSKSEGLGGDHILAITEDREGSLWVGTDGGLSCLADVKFPTLPPAEKLNGDYAAAVCPSRKGGIWIGSRVGGSYFDGKLKTYSSEVGLPAGPIKRIFEASNGDVYMVNGLSTLAILSEGKAAAIYRAKNLVVGMAEDAQGVIVSVGGELYRASKTSFEPYLFSKDRPDFKWILNLATAKDGALLVASEEGIFRIKDGVVQNWKAAEGLTDQRVQSICEDDDGVVWASLFTGIARLKDNRVCSIGLKEGLFDGNIYAVVPDMLGNLWVDSGRGIFRVSRRAMNDFADGKIPRIECVPYDSVESVDIADKNGTQERVGCRSLDGRVWFPSTKGVVMIDPSNILTNPVPPPVHLDQVFANRVPLKVQQRAAPVGAGELEFHFTALTFIAPDKTRVRYQLEGYDHGWIEAVNRHSAFYTNLRPGTYTFRVTAANSDGVWNKVGDSFEIELLPHFYQTRWFYFIIGSGLIGGFIGLYRWRTQRHRLRQRAVQHARELLETEVRNRTAELAIVNRTLQAEIDERKNTELELVKRTEALEKEIRDRIQMQVEIERVHRALLDASRQAGMAEIATNVLHNVGNVLNSVNVSSALTLEGLRKSSAGGLARAVTLLREHQDNLASFLAHDPRGQKLIIYLGQLSECLMSERDMSINELEVMREKIEQIKEIVAMQQNYTTGSGVKEVLNTRDLIEDSVRINHSSLESDCVELIREIHDVPPITADKHKILQILVNLINNAKNSCNESSTTDKRVIIRQVSENARIKISIVDNGVGVSPENLTRIFNHGFTTRKQGHGFALHSGAIAAKEMGGTLTVQSEGLGRGATFILELPCPALSKLAEKTGSTTKEEPVKV